MFVTPVEDMAWFPKWGKSSGGGTNEIVYVTNMTITIQDARVFPSICDQDHIDKTRSLTFKTSGLVDEIVQSINITKFINNRTLCGTTIHIAQKH